MNRDTIMVSVCMITYNHEPYIAEAIESVLMQKINFTFELVIGEDCSTDRTREICKIYKEKYPDQIKLRLPENNVGVMPNFIINLQACTGKYIALCEGDDYWIDPLKLQKQVDFLEQHPDYSMCFHNALVNNQLDKTLSNFNKKLNKRTFTVKDVILRPWFTPTASFVYRNHNFKIPDWKGANGDMMILFLNVTKGKIYYIDEIMSVYNYGTPFSLSLASNNKPLKLIIKKLKLLAYFDKYSNYKYIHLTMLKRIKMLRGIISQMLK